MFSNSGAADLTAQLFGSVNPDWRASIVGPTGGDVIPAGTPMPGPQQRPASPRRGGMFANGRLAEMGAMLLAMNGRPWALDHLDRRARLNFERDEAAQAAARRESLFNNMVKQGIDPGDAELAMSNPQAFGTEFNTRFRTREASAGESIFRPGFGRDAAPNVWTAPTQAEQDAETLGLQPGAPGYDTFIRDRTLGAQGPTAVDIARDRIGATLRGQDLTDARVRRGQTLTDARVRHGQSQSDATRRRGQDLRGSGGRGSGASATAVGPGGQRIYLRGGRWVDSMGRPVG